MEHTLLEDAVHPYLCEPQAGQPAPDGLMHIVHENDMPPLTNLEEEPRDEVVLGCSLYQVRPMTSQHPLTPSPWRRAELRANELLTAQVRHS